MRPIMLWIAFLQFAPLPRASWADPRPSSKELARRVDALVAPYQEMGVFSGTVLVAVGDRVVLRRAYGLADREHGVAMRPESIFRVASVAKGITDLAVGRLIERGALELDTPLARFLPGFPSADTITIDHLLTGRSGIAHINHLAWYEEASRFHHPLPDLVARIQSLPLAFPPGSRSAYSNGAYAVLARVIELASGRSYPEFVRDEVFVPLGMTHSAIETRDTIVVGRAAGYCLDVGGVAPAPYFEPSIKIGGGSLLTSAEDLFRLMRGVSTGRHLPGAIRDSVLRALTYDGSPAGPARLYAGGFQPGYNSSAQYYSSESLTVVVLSNVYARVTEDLSDGIVKTMLGRTPDAQRVYRDRPTDAADLDRLAGTYRFGRTTMTFARHGSRLAVVDSVRGSRTPMLAESATSMVDPQLFRRYRFRLDAEGRATGGEWEWLDVHITPRRPPSSFERDGVRPAP